MELLVDVFGLLSVIARGLVLIATAMAVGGVAFQLALARPLAFELGYDGEPIIARSERLLAWSGAGLVAAIGLDLFIQVTVLLGTTHMPLKEALGANFVTAGAVAGAAGLAMALAAFARRTPAWLLLGLALVMVAATVATSHAAARPESRGLAAAFTALHHLGAAVWIGGIPFLIGALALIGENSGWILVGRRYSLMAMAGVAGLLIGAGGLAFLYIDIPEGIYATAYGLMVSTKVLLLLFVLGLGFLNYSLVKTAMRGDWAPAIRLRRFAEAEIGIGMTIMLAAASLTSLPPAVDLWQGRVTLSEIGERLEPYWPRLATPRHDDLGIPALQAKLDAEARHHNAEAQRAFIPGSGEVPPRNAADIAWSEYNHHWAGVAVLAMGLLALLEKTGWAPWARNWPLLFLGLAGFLFFRSDPENWPMGNIGFWEGFRDPEVIEHRFYTLLIVVFAFFEWSVRTGRLKSEGAKLVFPLLTAFGGAFLLTHSHSLANVRDELLIEVTHIPVAVLGILIGWGRWLELRLPGWPGRVAGWVWPVALALCGLGLLDYREA